MSNVFDYKITEQVYDWIMNGTKNIEIRLYNEKSSQIKIDDIINFKVLDNEDKKIKVKVIGLLIYKDIDSLLENIDIKYIADVNQNDLKKMLYEIFGEEKVKNSYLIGLKFKVIDDILIDLNISKDPYIKQITNDNIINLTGQSGSGKSTYANENFDSDEYIIIDTDEIFSESRYAKAKGINKELGQMFREKYSKLPNLGDDFDLIYQDILDYCKNMDKTIVIDCAQFHCLKDISLLKGKIIIMRTDINTCYKRCIERYKKMNPNATLEEFNKYALRKQKIFEWYKYSNSFIEKIDELVI